MADWTANARAYDVTQLPAGLLPWREAPFTVIDFETTGLHPPGDEIISFATVTVSEGRLSLADARHRLIRPRRMPRANSIRIHGLRAADLEGADPLDDALGELLEAITGTVLVAHVAGVERAFLEAALETRGIALRNSFVDTASLAVELSLRSRDAPYFPVEGPVGLTNLARSYGLPVHRPHQADGDALTTGQVFLALATRLDAIEPQTVGSLLRPEYALPRVSVAERLRRRLRGERIRSSARP